MKYNFKGFERIHNEGDDEFKEETLCNRELNLVAYISEDGYTTVHKDDDTFECVAMAKKPHVAIYKALIATQREK